MATTTTPDLPSPPFHKIPNINNLRDCALFPLPTPTGRIRANLLFRSAEPSKLTLPDWEALHALGVAHVFDLRSAPEVNQNVSISKPDVKHGVPGEAITSNGAAQPAWMADMARAGVERSWVPVFAEADYSPEGLAKRYLKYMDEDVAGFVAAYQEILGAGGPAYRAILQYLIGIPPPAAGEADQKPHGALVHCTAGKDRTGVFFGVLFDFLGVDRQTIAAEYNLTELGLLPVRDAVVKRLMQSPAFQNYMLAQARGKPLSVDDIAKYLAVKDGAGGAGDKVELSDEIKAKGREAGLRMVGAKKESMLGALEMVDRVFGGSEKYLRVQCGLSDVELDTLRRVLVVKE